MDDLFSSALNNLSDSLVKPLLENLKSTISQVIQNRILEYQATFYQRCAKIKTILHINEVPLAQIYYPLTLSSQKNRIDIVPNSIQQIFEKSNNVTIIAMAGAGKTTISKFIYLDCFKKGLKIPLIINLRDVSASPTVKDKDLPPDRYIVNNMLYGYLKNHVLFHEISVDDTTFLKMLEGGKFLFILDGYDEVGNDYKSSMAMYIDEFFKRFPKNYSLITSRPHTAIEYLSGFENFQLNSLQRKEIPSFIEKQLFDNPILSKEIIQSLEKPISQQYLPYLENPLFSILFINSYEVYPHLPPKKSDFFRQVFDAVYEKHDNIAKLGYRRERLSKLDRESFEITINTLSYITYFESEFSFNIDRLINYLYDVQKSTDILFNNYHFIEDLKVALGIMVQDGSDIRFIHRTLQEFFATRVIYRFNEAAKHEFFKKLAAYHNENPIHSFLIELLSEQFPSEYKSFFIPEYINMYFDSTINFFRYPNKSSSELYDLLIRYEKFVEILNFDKLAKRIFRGFLQKYSNDVTIPKEFNELNKRIPKEDLVRFAEIQTLYHRRKHLYEMLNKLDKFLMEKNDELLRLVRKK